MELPALTDELLIVLGVAAVVIVALIVFAAITASRRRKQRQQLKERFGPEYDHAVDEHGTRKGVTDLQGRVEQRESFTPVDPGEDTRQRLRQRMAALQFRFADDPADVLLETQRVVLDGLRACGYPVAEDRERALKLLSVDHPEITPQIRSLLDGDYGGDVSHMQALFVAAKRALRDILQLTYSPDDLAGSSAAAAGPTADDAAEATPAGRSADRSAAAGPPQDQPRRAERQPDQPRQAEDQPRRVERQPDQPRQPEDQPRQPEDQPRQTEDQQRQAEHQPREQRPDAVPAPPPDAPADR